MAPPAGPIPAGTFKLAVLNALCFVSFAIITPVLDPLIRQRFGLGNQATGLFMAIHGAAALAFGLVAGIISDKLGRRTPLIVLGLLGSGLTTPLIPQIPSFRVLLVVRFLDGMFGALSLGLILTRALDLAGPANRNRTMGVMSIAIAAGFLTAPILTGLIGPRSLKLLFGLVGAALMAGGFWMMSDLQRPEHIRPISGGPRAIARALYGRPRLALPVAFAFADKFTFGTLAHLTSLAVKDLYGRGAVASSVAVFVFWVVFSSTSVPGSRLADRFGSVPTLIVGGALYGAALAGLGWVGFGGFLAMMALAGGFCAIQYVPSVSLVGEIADPSERGISMGVWNMAGSLGVVAGMIVSARLSASGYALAYGVAGGLMILAAAGAAAALPLWRLGVRSAAR